MFNLNTFKNMGKNVICEILCTKCSKIRNLTLLFILIVFSSLSVTATNLSDAKPISIQRSNISVKEALDIVKQQSGVYLMYQEKIIDR
mgnify:CR=1 FL=1